MKRLAVILLTACIMLSFSSCGVSDALLSYLGFDTYDYEGEAVTANLSGDEAVIEKLTEMTKILTLNSPILPEFDKTSEAVSSCRDSVLNYMLCTGFSKYTGNPELMEAAEKEYPDLRIITVIPAEDFENFIYTYFGGNVKLSNESSELFTYLDKVDAYTAVSVPVENNVEISVISCEETARTYRFVFRNILGDLESPVYRALVIKREDGSLYFKSLKSID